MMKLILAAGTMALMATAAQVQYRTYGTGSNSSSHSVSSYTTNWGTYVQPHTSTNRTARRWTTTDPEAITIPTMGPLAPEIRGTEATAVGRGLSHSTHYCFTVSAV